MLLVDLTVALVLATHLVLIAIGVWMGILCTQHILETARSRPCHRSKKFDNSDAIGNMCSDQIVS